MGRPDFVLHNFIIHDTPKIFEAQFYLPAHINWGGSVIQPKTIGGRNQILSKKFGSKAYVGQTHRNVVWTQKNISG